MPKILSRMLFFLMVISWSADLPAATRERAAGTLTRTRSAVYKMYQQTAGDTTLTEIGTETVTIRNYDDNTMIIESEMEMNFGSIGGPSQSLRTKSRLEVEEESLFPRRYEMTKTGRGVDQQVKIEMVSNVAVIDYRLNEDREYVKQVVTNGAMIVDASQLSQRWLLLQRLGNAAPGKLSLAVFDPILKRESTAVLDYQGEETITIRGEPGTFKRFRLTNAKSPVMQLFVDDAGMIARADNGAQRFVLDDFSDETLQDSSGD